MPIRYFLYSKQQFEFRRDIENKMGKIYKPGQVIVAGSKKQFTEISTTPTSKRFADAIMVTYGDIENMHYISPYTIKKGRNV